MIIPDNSTGLFSITISTEYVVAVQQKSILEFSTREELTSEKALVSFFTKSIGMIEDVLMSARKKHPKLLS